MSNDVNSFKSIISRYYHHISKIAYSIFPIEKMEWGKFIALAFMMFCTIYNHNVLRILKDTLIVTAMGAEAISAVKLYCVLPAAFLFTLVYIKLTSIMDYRNIYYAVTATFVAFFFIFGFILYPYQEYFHPSEATIAALIEHHPHFKWQIKIIGKWSYSLMYIMAELWTAVMLNLLFWQFANNITKTIEAKRFYPLLVCIGAFAVTLAGTTVKFMADIIGNNSHNYGNVELIQTLMIFLILSVIVLVGLYIFIHKRIMTNPKLYTPKDQPSLAMLNKESLISSIKFILQSHYLRMMVLIVISYGMTINLVELPWKSKIKELYPTEISYAHFNGYFLQWFGIIEIPTVLVCSYILRRFSWFTSAIMTPSVIGITGLLFFISMIVRYYFLPDTIHALYIDSLILIVLFGAIQNILSKATKYCLYDATKEMAYIPASHELRTKGKSAVDVVGSRLGKSTGAFVQSIIFMIFPIATYDMIAPVLMVIFILVIYMWFYALKKLNKEYLALSPESV